MACRASWRLSSTCSPAPHLPYLPDLYLQVVDCAGTEQPSAADYPLLLAAAQYLRVPVVFDEFTFKWTDLPAALNGQLRFAGLHAE